MTKKIVGSKHMISREQRKVTYSEGEIETDIDVVLVGKNI